MSTCTYVYVDRTGEGCCIDFVTCTSNCMSASGLYGYSSYEAFCCFCSSFCFMVSIKKLLLSISDKSFFISEGPLTNYTLIHN